MKIVLASEPVKNGDIDFNLQTIMECMKGYSKQLRQFYVVMMFCLLILAAWTRRRLTRAARSTLKMVLSRKSFRSIREGV